MEKSVVVHACMCRSMYYESHSLAKHSSEALSTFMNHSSYTSGAEITPSCDLRKIGVYLKCQSAQNAVNAVQLLCFIPSVRFRCFLSLMKRNVRTTLLFQHIHSVLYASPFFSNDCLTGLRAVFCGRKVHAIVVGAQRASPSIFPDEKQQSYHLKLRQTQMRILFTCSKCYVQVLLAYQRTMHLFQLHTY